MATDLIRYDLLVQDAMRSVVRKVLGDVAASGYLPGDHHFTISFKTDAPGVKISRRLAEQWPQELTIILQHQYTNLEVDDEGFGVTLSFRSIPERLYVPYASITGFYDPSVEFGLRFEAADMEEEEEEEEEVAPARPSLVAARPAEEKAEAKPEPQKLEKADSPKPAAAEAAEGEGDAKVVSIDAFRKKT
ncbi:SspB family protein [Methylocystis iwaonis]|uniref:SspB family protein n=1 Tax=Methylocystis iwaonis TaxID=2885079 RepID=UPI002E7BFBA7|nr:ClpXP protease specificity-enhancing factor SspB [Methylocystis iwaonis]